MFGPERGAKLVAFAGAHRRCGVRPDRQAPHGRAACAQWLDPGRAFARLGRGRAQPRRAMGAARRAGRAHSTRRRPTATSARRSISAAGSTGAAAPSSRSPMRAASPAPRLRPAPRSTAQTPRHGARARRRRWNVTTERGAAVTADSVVICTNGYTGELVPRLRAHRDRAELLPDRDRAAVRQHPQIDPALRAGLVRHAQAAALFPPRPRGPFIMGGRGPFREPRERRRLGASRSACCRQLFPQLKGAPIEYRWCGRVAITRDFLPHLHEPEPGLLDRHRLHGPRRRRCRPRWAGRWRTTSRLGKCRRAAVAAAADPAAAVPCAEQALFRRRRRVVPLPRPPRARGRGVTANRSTRDCKRKVWWPGARATSVI